MYLFKLNQFLVASEINLPCDPFIASFPAEEEEPHVRVLHIPGALSDFKKVTYMNRRYFGYLRVYDVDNGILLSGGDNIKIFIQRDGREVIVDAHEEALEEAGLYIINLVASICTLFQGELPLHGAGAEVQGKFIGVMAPSGSGKSTFLWNLLKSGALFGNDDVIPIEFYEDQVYAYPSVSLHSKVRKPTLEHCMKKGWIEIEQCNPIPSEIDEFWVRIEPSQRVVQPRPLHALFILQPKKMTSSCTEIHLEKQSLLAARELLARNTQALWAVHQLIDKKDLLLQYTALAKYVPLYTISYPRHFGVLPELVKRIEEVVAVDEQPARVIA